MNLSSTTIAIVAPHGYDGDSNLSFCFLKYFICTLSIMYLFFSLHSLMSSSTAIAPQLHNTVPYTQSLTM